MLQTYLYSMYKLTNKMGISVSSRDVWSRGVSHSQLCNEVQPQDKVSNIGGGQGQADLNAHA